jgi:hypothetical protein
VSGNLVQRSNALLESQQALVDLGSLHPCLVVCVAAICSALGTCKVDKAEFAVQSLGILLVPEANLENGMGARRIVVGASRA